VPATVGDVVATIKTPPLATPALSLPANAPPVTLPVVVTTAASTVEQVRQTGQDVTTTSLPSP
jgi:hypothetical protein